ncbi:hypothetical protein A500_11999 [Clostridium sartagoforme AAU1]|uniref:Rhoptry protein n=1 Tax=Clostridium sartagoforme AAU1 TaxID=1202534 RepID=R9CBV5_9CLOT|nr:hypothetical protein [Clostridium sartagoforme]EOR24696.1 hypothetical protein A500_11999 [Clostridium sartagoforme AAU1]
MPGVFNVGNNYNINNKRISSKLTFDTGEKFSGKIIKKEGSNEATIKLIDGWEFSAEIDGDMDSLDKGLQRFQVEGFEGGKLKLKVIGKNVNGEETSQSELKEILSKLGLKKEDIKLVKSMINFEIPLTKENIREIKGLIQFLDKIQEDPKEIEEFVNKYLMGKGISQNSEEGSKINNILKEFLSEFKTLSKEDILLFFENDIEFTKENIKGYNDIFKGKENISKLLDDISSSLSKSKEEILTNEVMSNSAKEKITQEVSEENLNFKMNGNIKKSEVQEDLGEALTPKLDVQENNEKESNTNNKLANDVYQKRDILSSKVSVLSLLRSLSGQNEDLINISLKDILNNRRMEFTSNEFDRTLNSINSLKPEEFISMIKDTIFQFNEIGAKDIVDDFNNYLNKSNNEALGIIGALDLSKGELEKVLSSVMGKGITLTEEEFFKLKDIINLKHQEITEVELNNTDKSITKENLENLNNDISGKVSQEVNGNKEQINPNNILSKNLNNNIPTKNLVESSLNKGAEENKEIIKDIISNIKGDSIVSEKVLDIIKNNINNIKIFNKISSEYYYADIPVNIREREYPCKIIVKDNRKEGKRIDSTNVKMVITIDTKTLGIVDGYMKVLDKK